MPGALSREGFSGALLSSSPERDQRVKGSRTEANQQPEPCEGDRAMRPLWGIGSVCALLLVAADVSAAWNNVFQVCCAGCGRQQAAVSQYAAAPAAPDACCNP